MNIAYNSYGVPFLIAPDGEIIEFNHINAQNLVSELSMEPEVLEKIKSHIVDSVKTKVSEYLTTNIKNFEQFKQAFVNLNRLSEFFIVIEICNQAEDLYLHATAEKPYASWIWDSSLRQYKAPVPPPSGLEGEIYHWDEATNYWKPIEPAPHSDWEWDFVRHKWVASTAYPEDAGPGEFTWDEESSEWVLNR